jgi:hypothetical protein
MAAMLAQNIDDLKHIAAFDQDRIFCNSFGALKNPSLFILIGRETLRQDGADALQIEKNIGSWVMPHESAEKLRDLLLENFPLEPK